MAALLQDVRFALRILLRKPGITVAAWLSLALGTGALTAIFSVVNGLLIQPLSYTDSERLVLVWETDLNGPPRRMGGASDATFLDWRQETRSFAALGAHGANSKALTSLDVPESLFTRPATAAYFTILGVEPMLGRTISEEEEVQGAKVVILSHDVWQRHLGGDPSILGRTVELDNEPWEVIGVMAADYHCPIEPAPVKLWIPLTLDAENLNRGRRRLLIYGRLAEGVSVETAQQEMTEMGAELARRYPDVAGGRGAQVQELQTVLVGSFRPALLTLLAAGAALLLIVCGNVAHLLLLRGLERRREIAIRCAMGAGRSHLLRQLLTENLMLALAGSGTGLVLAHVGLRLIKTLIPARFELPRLNDVGIDIQVVLFSLAVALVTVVIFGLVPTRMALFRTNLGNDLSAGSMRATSGRGGRALRAFLVVADIALVLVLLVGAALMVQTVERLGEQEAAQDPAHLLTLRASPSGPDYQEGMQRSEFFRRAVEAVQAVPGVAAAAATDLIVLTIPRGGARFALEGMAVAEPGSEPEALVQIVTPDYFETLGIPLLQGRSFTDSDTADAPPTVMVNRRFVATFMDGQQPLGQGVTLMAGGDDATRRVVGVVDDVRVYSEPPDLMPVIYLPHAQRPVPIMTLYVRTRTEPEPLIQSIRGAISSLDRLVPTYAVTTLERSLAEADWQARFSMLLLGFFTSLALVLALSGIYAVMSAGIYERNRELGIRMAFGAKPGEILTLVLKSGLRLAAAGIVVGIVAALFCSRLIESQLYGVTTTDLKTYVGLSLLLAFTVALACAIPAFRAWRLDPIRALRQD